MNHEKEKTNKEKIEEMEKRFLKHSKLLELSEFPITQNDTQSMQTINKEKSDEFGEVWTPVWLIDEMIQKTDISKLHKKRILDLCAGYGNFTIRMIRAMYEYDNNFDVRKWLKEKHTFVELQLESCCKILDIFGCKINLYCGDACNLNMNSPWGGKFYWDDKQWKKTSKSELDRKRDEQKNIVVESSLDNCFDLIKEHNNDIWLFIGDSKDVANTNLMPMEKGIYIRIEKRWESLQFSSNSLSNKEVFIKNITKYLEKFKKKGK